MQEALTLVAFVGLIASTLWWPRPVTRAVGSLLLGGIVFVFARGSLGLAGGAALALGVSAAAWALVPLRVQRRVCFMVLTLVLLVFVTTLLMYLAPGNPFRQEKQANEQVEAALREKYGVPASATAFFGIYMKRVLTEGSLGPSIKDQGRTVEELLLPAFPVSMTLGLLALTLATVLGLFLGVRAGLRPNTFTDQAGMAVAMLGISVPSFVIGATFIILFALNLGWLPVAGWGGYRHLILPADHAGAALRRLHRPPGPHRHARGDAAGLHPHGPRQGPLRARGRAQARAQGRGAAGGVVPGPRRRRHPDRLASWSRTCSACRAWGSGS